MDKNPAAVNFMKDVSAKILISDIFLDESIYPRENIDHKRIGIFAENLRDGFVFEPIVVQVCPDPEIAAKKGKYHILDGVHRWCAYKKMGITQIDVVIKTLNNIEPILYAAKMAIGGQDSFLKLKQGIRPDVLFKPIPD